jgi:REP element-mobilizing transposase RayT
VPWTKHQSPRRKKHFYAVYFTWPAETPNLNCLMAIHNLVTDPGIYFSTFTCHNWYPLIDITNSYDKVYKWFDIFTSYGNAINGYVIMPNHLHALLYYNGQNKSLNRMIGNAKRFLAYDIIKRLEKQNEHALLEKLSQAVTPFYRKRGYRHEVWEESFDLKKCWTENFVLQKLNYIHNNPCKGKWKLAESPVDYFHSSASFYVNGKMGGYPVRDYREFLRYEE